MLQGNYNFTNGINIVRFLKLSDYLSEESMENHFQQLKTENFFKPLFLKIVSF